MAILDKVDLSAKISQDKYKKILPDLQLRLICAQQSLKVSNQSLLIMYEGWDASGKGGSIARITEKLDPRGFQVWPVNAPNELENQYNYLWRFWNKLPTRGAIGILDRSWYGRVLVERVEGFATVQEWKRAYDEIVCFEKTIVNNKTILIKFMLHISKEEQLKRFQEREKNPFKRWKITPDDWHNREKWDEYQIAAEDMFKKTNSDFAPWHIIPAENKLFARIETLRIVVETLEKELKL